MLAIRRYGVLSAVDTAFWVFRRHFQLLAILGALIGSVNIVFGLVSLYFGPDAAVLESEDPRLILIAYAEKAGLLLTTLVVGLLVGAFGTAAATRIATRLVLGEEASLGDAVRVASSRFLPVLGATLISSLAGGLGLVVLVIPGLYILLGFAFVAPVIIAEGASATESLGRSWRLAKGQRLKLLGAFVLVVVVLGSLAIGVDLALRLVFSVEDFFTLQLAQTIVSGLLNAVLSPIYYLVIVLFYFSARVEHEAFDVEKLSEA